MLKLIFVDFVRSQGVINRLMAINGRTAPRAVRSLVCDMAAGQKCD